MAGDRCNLQYSRERTSHLLKIPCQTIAEPSYVRHHSSQSARYYPKLQTHAECWRGPSVPSKQLQSSLFTSQVHANPRSRSTIRILIIDTITGGYGRPPTESRNWYFSGVKAWCVRVDWVSRRMSCWLRRFHGELKSSALHQHGLIGSAGEPMMREECWKYTESNTFSVYLKHRTPK